jgi:hypothetical protein
MPCCCGQGYKLYGLVKDSTTKTAMTLLNAKDTKRLTISTQATTKYSRQEMLLSQRRK